MKTPLCPYCVCSLIRLGISKDRAVSYTHDGEEYLFCCQGCQEQFTADPQTHPREKADFEVCPVCLTEKPRDMTVELALAGEVFHACRCTHCQAEFKKHPEYYVRRVAGEEKHPGTFEAACCAV